MLQLNAPDAPRISAKHHQQMPKECSASRSCAQHHYSTSSTTVVTSPSRRKGTTRSASISMDTGIKHANEYSSRNQQQPETPQQLFTAFLFDQQQKRKNQVMELVSATAKGKQASAQTTEHNKPASQYSSCNNSSKISKQDRRGCKSAHQLGQRGSLHIL
ncbi:hypothetical protein Nepgr_016362 [Nepenthes gracilis]|uniref:Uncharacterized protein n=1 Tax=Nepenthes gracilis TaxID=150966 RepID=A0AAD3XS80_NEPGR|nr:hypothetical protein Nepgr_016362 [Nepenthes gracilis]